MKRKPNLFLLILLIGGLAAGAQDTTLLRLKKMADDTTKVKSMLAYGKEHWSEAEKATIVFSEALATAGKINYADGEARAHLGLAYVCFATNQFDDCIGHYRAASKIFQRLFNLREMCGAMLDMAAGFSAKGKRDSAFYYCMSALKMLEATPYAREKARANLNLGTQYNNIKSFDDAIIYQKKALDISLQANDTPMILNTYSLLSLSYENKEMEQEAYAMMRHALNYLTPRSNKFSACRTYNQLANAAAALHQHDEAVKAAKKTMEIAEELNDINHYGAGANTLATVYSEKGDYKKALEVLEDLRRKTTAFDNPVAEDFYELLAKAYYATGAYKNAADAYNKLLPLKDSAFQTETKEMIAQQEVSYKTAQKERQLSENKMQLLLKDLQLQKNRYYMYYTLAALAVALLILAIFFIRSRHKKRLHEQELKTVHQQKELQLLQALMQGEEKERSRIAKDLHDGVAGMLAAVKMHFSSMPGSDTLAQAEGYQQGMKLLNEATQEIRKTSHNLMPEVLLQHGLDEALRRYCNNVNNSKVLQIQYDSWGEIDRFNDSFELSVYRIVQELINNIIKHSKATQAIVQLSQQDEMLSISIEDNGVGFAGSEAASEGMGLRSLQSRIKAMNGKLEVESSQQTGVSAYLEFEISELKKRTALAYE